MSAGIATEVDICNVALSFLGQRTISGFDDGPEGAACATQYPAARDAVLREHKWNCAVEMATLQPLTEAPAFRFAYQYQLPPDFIRLISVNDEFGADHRIVKGLRLLTNNGTANIEYVSRITAVSQMTEGLKQTVAAKVAMLVALRLTGSRERQDAAAAWYMQELSAASNADATEGPVETIEPETWYAAHHGVTDGVPAASVTPQPYPGV